MKFSSSIKECILLFILMLMISSCDENNDDNIIVDYAGTAEYFINNQTDKNIIIIFMKPEELGFEIDTTSIIEKNTSSKILEDAMLGNNPLPKNSFRELIFYESNDLNNPILTLSPVENEDWTIINQDFGSSGYGLTTYEIELNE